MKEIKPLMRVRFVKGNKLLWGYLNPKAVRQMCPLDSWPVCKLHTHIVYEVKYKGPGSSEQIVLDGSECEGPRESD